MEKLIIQWQRLLDKNGQTCQRCGSTEKEVEKAFSRLKQSLIPLGIEVVLEKTHIDFDTFAKDPPQSNRIWIAGKPLEEWLEGKVGQSPCCGPCGEAECRTIEFEDQTHETIPEYLIVKAGLLAAAQLFSHDSKNKSTKSFLDLKQR